MAADITEYKVKISGAKLMHHNGQLANPLNEYTKELKAVVKAAKKSKSDVDIEAVYKAEFMGGLYHDEKLGPYVPGENILSAIIKAAGAFKQGKTAKAAVRVAEEIVPIAYKGPRDRAGLWAAGTFADIRGAKVGMSRVMRTRPIFKDWSVTFTIQVFGGEINGDELERIVERAGLMEGIGDGRPRIAGLFSVDEFEEV
jgi:hypothetical protein